MGSDVVIGSHPARGALRPLSNGTPTESLSRSRAVNNGLDRAFTDAGVIALRKC